MTERAQYPTQGVFRQVAKSAIGRKVPYPIYQVPFRFRGRDRVLEYTLYGEAPRIGCNLWLVCLGEFRVGPRRDMWLSCKCCPEFDSAEEHNAQAVVAVHVTIPGDPVR